MELNTNSIPAYIYHAWSAIVQRCCNPNNKAYPRYGGRGIVVCESIKQGAANLFGAIGHRPTADHSIDRSNNSQGYTCGECSDCLEHGWNLNLRWATKREQMLNRDCVHRVTIGDATKTLPEWSVATGISHVLLYDRYRKGWRGSKLIQPVQRQFGPITINGITKTVQGWADTVGVRYMVIWKRLCVGKTGEALISPRRKYPA